MEPYLFHGFRDFNVDVVCRVLENGFILPRKMINDAKTDCNNIFNGNAWISLCQKSLMDTSMYYRFRDSYSEWILDRLCIVIDNNIDGLRFTNYIDPDECYASVRKRLVYDENPERYSYYMDEVQTNIPIPSDKFLAIGYPVDYFRSVKSFEEMREDISKIYKILEEKGLNIPVINSSEYSFADNSECIRLSKIMNCK